MDTSTDGEGDIYRTNIYSGTAERVERGSDKFGALQADAKGEIRAKVQLEYEDGKAVYIQWIKNPKGVWEPHFRSYFKDRNIFGVAAFSDDPNIVYVTGRQPGPTRRASTSTTSRPRRSSSRPSSISCSTPPAWSRTRPTASWASAIKAPTTTSTGSIPSWRRWTRASARRWASRPRPGLDRSGHRAEGQDQHPGRRRPVGALLVGRPQLDHRAEIGPQGAGRLLPVHQGRQAVAAGQGPPVDQARDPGRHAAGRVHGARRPADPRLPDHAPASAGAGPFPTIILPHGGPWARDALDWDVSGWTQYFASRGYAVLQPQFRGSDGWGRKLWTAGDNEWGQKMQDDKDDGAKWLIDQKIADPNRIAMFGYSYGGYSALAAAIRPNGLYQCAVSGAGGSLSDMKRVTADSRTMREYQRPFVGGLDAIQNAGDAKIPIFLYHGDRDQIVDIKDSRRFIAGLKAANKPYKWLEIKDMGHQYVTMTPDMMETQLVEIEKFFQNEVQARRPLGDGRVTERGRLRAALFLAPSPGPSGLNDRAAGFQNGVRRGLAALDRDDLARFRRRIRRCAGGRRRRAGPRRRNRRRSAPWRSCVRRP